MNTKEANVKKYGEEKAKEIRSTLGRIGKPFSDAAKKAKADRLKFSELTKA